MEVSPLTSSFGHVVRRDPAVSGRATLLDLPRADITGLLNAGGAVVFRGFEADSAEFERFTERFGTSDATRHPALHGGARDVYFGRSELSAHAELAYTPWPPDLIWFHMLRPAKAGGRTTLYDGVQFLERMEPHLRTRFSGTKIRFVQRIPQRVLVARYARALGRLTTDAELASLGLRFGRRGPDDFEVCFETWAIRTTRTGLRAFCNSVLNALDAPDYYGMSFVDGAPMTGEMVASLRATASAICVPLELHAGDVVVVDNSRVMHGRERYDDPERSLKARHALADF